MSPIQKMSRIAKHGQGATRQMVETVLDGQEKMARANLDAVEAILKQGTQQFRDFSAQLGAQFVARFGESPSLDHWPQMTMENIQRGTAYNLACIEIARQLHQGMTSTLEDSLRSLRDCGLEMVDQWSDAAALLPRELAWLPSQASQRRAA